MKKKMATPLQEVTVGGQTSFTHTHTHTHGRTHTQTIAPYPNINHRRVLDLGGLCLMEGVVMESKRTDSEFCWDLMDDISWTKVCRG